MISIITATYNREKFLPRLYDSLCKQTSISFEWLVVDDGSTDNTFSLIQKYINENILDIKYIRKENGGKHTAMNLGVSSAKYEYTFFVDSDDYLPNTSLEIIINNILLIRNFSDYANISGICGNNIDAAGHLIGDECPNSIVMNYLDFRYKLKIKGDKSEIFKTQILKDYKFPEFEGEKFCPEALVWNRIALQYDMFFFNKAIYVRDYQNNGLTSKIIKIRKESPNSTLLYYKEFYETKDVNNLVRIKALINFWRFYYNSDLKNYSGGLPSSNLNFVFSFLMKVYFRLYK